MTYSFSYRDEKGFAIELENADDDEIVYIGQVYGDTQSFSGNSVYEAEQEFKRVVDESLDAEEEFDYDD